MNFIFALMMTLSFSALASIQEVASDPNLKCNAITKEVVSQHYHMGSVTYLCQNNTKIKLDYTPSLSRISFSYQANGAKEHVVTTNPQDLAVMGLTIQKMYENTDEYKLKKHYEYRLPVPDIKSQYR